MAGLEEAAHIVSALTEEGTGAVIFQGEGQIPQVVGNGRSHAESLLDPVADGTVEPHRTDVRIIDAEQFLRHSQALHVTAHARDLELPAVLEGEEGSPVLHRRVREFQPFPVESRAISR